MKFLFSVLSILVLILAALLIVPSFIDWSQYKDQIRTQVREATGYDLQVNGPLRAAFLPSPHVNLNEVVIDSADAQGAYAFAGEAEKASVSLALMPLLSGTIQVNDVSLSSSVITVRETNAPRQTAEQRQLEELTSADKGQNTGSAPNVSLDNVTLDNVKITYQPQDGEAMSVTFPKFNISAGSLKGPFNFNGRVLYNDFDLNVDGKVDEMVSGQPIPMAVSVKDRAYEARYSGILDTTGEVPAFQGEVSISAPSIKTLAQSFGANDVTVKDQSMALQGMINGTSKAVQLSNGQLKLGQVSQPMPVQFAYDIENQTGRFKVQNLPQGGMVDMDITMPESGMTLAGQVMIESLPALLSDALGVVDAATFQNPNVPKNANGDVRVQLGDTITARSQKMILGRYNVQNVNATYQKGDNAKLNLSIGDMNGAAIQASGTMDMESGVNVKVTHPNAAQFIQIFNPEFKSSDNLEKPLRFSGLVKFGDKIIQVENMDAAIGTIDMKGGMTINLSGNIPSIQANMAFGELDTQALMTGKTSKARQGGGGTSSASSAGNGAVGGSAPWSRDAIDTSALRAINLDLNAKAQSLVHGTWRVTNPELDINLQNGVLDIQNITGGLFDGTVSINSRVAAQSEGQPISVSSSIKAENVNLNRFVKAALSQTQDRVVGTGNLTLNMTANGVSSSALIYSLNADGRVNTSDLIVRGIDLAKVTEAISDESLTDLAAAVRSAFREGQTPFQAVDHPIVIREGAMAVNNLRLVSPTASLISNGSVNFAAWNMNLTNTVDFTQPDDLPNVEMTLRGPLNAPQKNVANDILVSFIKNKYGAKIQNKVQELVGDKLGSDNPAGAIINNLLGLPQQQQQQPQEQAPAANDNQPTPTTETDTEVQQPQTQTQPQQREQSPEEQVIRGLIDQFAR